MVYSILRARGQAERGAWGERWRGGRRRTLSLICEMGSISKDKPNTTQHREKLARRLLSFPSLYLMGERKHAERSETWIIRVVLIASTEPKKTAIHLATRPGRLWKWGLGPSRPSLSRFSSLGGLRSALVTRLLRAITPFVRALRGCT